MISGWAVEPNAIYRYQVDAAFPLSDHADYDDLLRYVELVQPKRVLTLHGFAAEFARDLRERGRRSVGAERAKSAGAHAAQARLRGSSLHLRAPAKDPACANERVRIPRLRRSSVNKSPPLRPNWKKSASSPNTCARSTRSNSALPPFS